MSYDTYAGPDDEEQSFSVAKLTKDLRTASETMTDAEARFLVDAYYIAQKSRITQRQRVETMADEPHEVLTWLGTQHMVLENQIKAALDRYTTAQPMGVWMKSIHGIGPIISAGLLAHIDMDKAPTAGHIWRFAGLDPTQKWRKGEKRPWNARLKQICWHAGECFKRFSGSPKCYYGHLYIQRKLYEVNRNDSGGNAETAAATMIDRRFSDAATKAIYASGKLPPGRLDLRATRWATKQFLADMHGQWYRVKYAQEPPLPYPIAHLGHVHFRDSKSEPSWTR